MNRLLRSLLFITVLDGCATSHLSMQVQVMPRNEAVARIMDLDEKLHSGDHFALRGEVTRPAYLYVRWTSPPQQLAPLFPKEGHRQMPPGVPFVIPEGDPVRLADRACDEELWIVASLKKLDETQVLSTIRARSGRADRSADKPRRAADKTTDKPRQAAAKLADKDPSPPPKTIKQGERDGSVASASFDAAGLAVLRLAFRHE